MLEQLVENKHKIKEIFEKDENFIENLTSEELFQIIITFSKDPEIKPLIQEHIDKILYRCTTDYDMFNCFTIICLKVFKVEVEKAQKCLDITINKTFSHETICYLLKIIRMMKNNGVIPKEELFEIIIRDLNKLTTDKSSKILFDLYIFPDFKLLMNIKYRVVSTLIEAYQLYDPNIMSSQIINGSTIIGKLLKGKNELIVARYLRDLLKEKQISTRNIQMVGGGGSCLVFRIDDKVIKLGEKRNDRRIFINHRILASLIRNLEHDEHGKELFYVEVMKYALTGDVTPEERDELKKDLYDQGLIWEDSKLANCGVLVDGDTNFYEREIDYKEIVAHIDNPVRREEFTKRKRRVVVIDNDHMSFNPMRSCR